MKKSIIWILIITLIMPITYVYAINEEEIEFFEISEQEATAGETIEMTINLSMIEYENFTFKLESNHSLESIEIEDDEEESSDEENANNDEIENVSETEIQIQIANYDNVNKIVLLYDIPDTLVAGEKIEFIATIININDEEQYQEIKIEVEIIEQLNDEDDSNNEEISENQEQETNNNIAINKNSLEENYSSNLSETDEKTMTTVSSTTEESRISASTNSTEEVTYNGSDNNYLSQLSIDDMDLNQEFKKENTTYFVTIESNTDELEINAEAEDDEAIVCIYGNEELQTGVNKILISVTAENGNVRYYRIYATKQD